MGRELSTLGLLRRFTQTGRIVALVKGLLSPLAAGWPQGNHFQFLKIITKPTHRPMACAAS